MQQKETTLTIIGAGLTGSFLAILLAKRGYKVRIYERSAKNVHLDSTSKRSYNLTFYKRGIDLIKVAGIWPAIKPKLIRLDGTVLHTAYSKTFLSKFPIKNGYFTIERSMMLSLLLQEAASNSNVTVYYGHELLGVNESNRTIEVRHAKTKRIKSTHCDVLIGADGVHSLTRTAFQGKQRATHKIEYSSWTYKQININSDAADRLSLRKHAMHVWSRENVLLVAFPNSHDAFSLMLTLPGNSSQGFNALSSKQEIKKFMKDNFPELLPALSEFTKSLRKNPEGKFMSVYTSPWYFKDFITVMGDAAHGMLPFHGQGVTVGFEDCLAFVNIIDQYGADWKRIFPLFQEMRKKDADILTTLSQENFMRFRRHKEADFNAIHDKLDSLLNTFSPRLWNPPLNILIATSSAPFSEIHAKHMQQRKVARYIGISFLAQLIVHALVLKEKTHEFRLKYGRTSQLLVK